MHPVHHLIRAITQQSAQQVGQQIITDAKVIGTVAGATKAVMELSDHIKSRNVPPPPPVQIVPVRRQTDPNEVIALLGLGFLMGVGAVVKAIDNNEKKKKYPYTWY